jgi:PilZ domain
MQQPSRRTDRVEVRIPIEISGEDMMGSGFVEGTFTVLISRHGAKILSRQELLPDQQCKIRFLENGKESLARVVGLIHQASEGNYYGVAFLDNSPDLWNVGFPPLAEAENALSRLCMKCLGCNSIEVAYLNEFEAEVYVANKGLSRNCNRCNNLTLWREAQLPTVETGSAAPSWTEEETRSLTMTDLPVANRRQHQRLRLKQPACVRSLEFGEEIVVTEDASRGGMSFKSPNRYSVGQQIQVAVPFSKLSLNIFFPARIAHIRPRTGKELHHYGVQYVIAKQEWPRSK